MSTGHLIDTSIFIGSEQGRAIGSAPLGEARISVATLTELELGLRRAADPLRQVRAATLARARRFIALSYDEAVASQLAALLVTARHRGRRAAVMDTIIAATALAHDLTVWTQDDDFDVLAELEPRLRVHRNS